MIWRHEAAIKWRATYSTHFVTFASEVAVSDVATQIIELDMVPPRQSI